MNEIPRRLKQSTWWPTILRIRSFHSDKKRRAAYFANLDTAIRRKKIVVHLPYGGLGDVLIYSSLPRLLKEQLNVDFYLSESSTKVVRHPDIMKLCFEMNPFFKGFAPDSEGITLAGWDRHRFFFVPERNRIATYEHQFGLRGNGLPEIFYTPKSIPSFANTLLIDKNMIAGKALGWKVSEEFFSHLIEQAKKQRKAVTYVDPTGQDLFTYADMLHSSWRFVCLYSGSHALAVALHKPAYVVVPENFDGGGIAKFIYPQSSVTYLRKRNMKRYLYPYE